MTKKKDREEDGVQVSLRLDDSEIGYLASLQKASGLDRSSLIRLMLRFAFQEWVAGKNIFPRTRIPEHVEVPTLPVIGGININNTADASKKRRGGGKE